ncbi:MAG: hypothetical protein KKC68_08655 [Candidatus Thermoplasmatota archaeon]|nr:hypothetical protein [Candidatus Thermoplasmatota archaeon]MBU1941829.1 hypothetical protein [Candidatus Thermoplasmatota archaeon]
MDEKQLDTHIDTIINTVKDNKVSRDEILKELQRFLEYGVPLDHATQTLIKKYGGTYTPISSERTLLADIQSPKSSVNLLCRVIAITPKTTTVKGEEKTLYYGMVADESGSLSFTAWEDFQLQTDDVIEVTNAYLREWRGALKLNFGERTKIEKTDQKRIPKDTITPQTYTLNDLHGGIGLVEVTARIETLNKRTIETNGTTKTLFSGVLSDETAKSQFTAWHDFKLKEKDIIKISGGYVRTWKGIPQLTFDERSTVTKLPDTTLPETSIPPRTLLLYELEELQGGFDIEITGTVLEIRDGSGIINRCPQCKRTLQDTTCTIHGSVTPEPDLRLKLIIDDGTGAISTILDKNTTEQILGKTFKDIQNLEKKQGHQAVREELYAHLFCQQLVLRGNALSDDYGLTLIVKNAEIVPLNIEEQHDSLLQEMETIP